VAKQKGGLGRGLNSLFGTPSEETSRSSVHEPVSEPTRSERYMVDAKEDDASHTSPEPAPEATRTVEREEVEFEESVYTDLAENTTIKSVRSREVSVNNETEKAKPVAEKAVDEVDIDNIEPNPDQPRTRFKKDELEELGESIKKDGLLQPILVRELENGRYQIIAGERRWQACRSIGLKKVPIRIKKADDSRAIELALVENIQRSDLNPIEEAYGYRRMMERGNMTQSEVAQKVSKGRSTIANALRLLELPEDAQQLLFEEKITAGHARAILSIPTEEGRAKLTEKLVKEKLSVREAETLARLFSGKKSETPTKRVATPSSFKRVARALRKSFNTNVRVKTVKGKNKIEIEFSDERELQRLLELMAPEKAARMKKIVEDEAIEESASE
jgi:ParB family transcriptional regulator, chromosome partitioning protein